MADTLDVPADLVFDVPRLTLIGSFQLVVENHHGLLVFEPNRLVIGAGGGRIVVEGGDLGLAAVREGEIVVRGRITGISFAADPPPGQGEV